MSIVIESDKVKHHQTEETGCINGSRLDIPTNYFGTLFVTGITIFIIVSTMCFGISQQRCKILLLILSAGIYVKTASNVSCFIILEKTKGICCRFDAIYL